MTDRPIIFSAPMIRALLAGTKTQTRRLAKPQPVHDGGGLWRWAAGAWSDRLPGPVLAPGHSMARAAHFAIGDRLWVRESWRTESDAYNDLKPSEMSGEEAVLFEADADWSQNKSTGRRHAAMHMPRWASRLTLTVTEVRVERLQAISGADTIAEGVECTTCAAMAKSACGKMGCPASLLIFSDLWTSINGAGAWEANPWVVAVTFTIEKTNIDAVTS